MQKILAIAGNTVTEARRHRVFTAILFFAVLIIANSFLFTNLTVATHDRILRDVGTTAIDFFGVLLAIFLGIGMVSREVDRRTVYTVVTKPVRRSEFIVGKFLGLMGVLAVTLLLMFLCLSAVVAVIPATDPANHLTLLWHVVLRWFELMVLVAFAILMSTFASTAVSAFSTVAFYVIGHLTTDLRFFGSRSESAVGRALSEALYWVLPNLDHFDVSYQIAYARPVDPSRALLALAYGLLYAAALLAASMAIFERRDFK